MIRGFIFGFSLALIIIFTHQYQQSFDRCQTLLTEVKQNLSILEQELSSLQNAVDGVTHND